VRSKRTDRKVHLRMRRDNNQRYRKKIKIEGHKRSAEHWWKAKIKNGNYIYIYSDDVKKSYMITAVRKDIKWTDYGGSRSPERVGIDINSTHIIIIYHHRDQQMDSVKIREELKGGG
jgi:hypothetical protein